MLALFRTTDGLEDDGGQLMGSQIGPLKEDRKIFRLPLLILSPRFTS